VPYPLLWSHEHVEADRLEAHERYRRIESLHQLADTLEAL
jgi:hypothetical protein